MSKPIKISYFWDKENIERLFDASYKYQFNNSGRRFIGWFFVALLQYGVVVALKKNAFAILLFSTLMLAYWYYGKKIIARRRAKKSFENSEFKNKTINIDVSNEGFNIKSNEGSIYWSWDEVDEIVALGDDILLYKYPHFHYIPLNAFESIEEKNRFKKMAKKYNKIKG